ncbi:MAG: hypothetical protein COT17_08000 [Elusimicrobia bacterium CG08_land_8_20_14_0_20_51_18]|nr:MAG: hypothetical protein COT17_08000 [Elusimicrobia bacterium CG08_land_8_20_14_0_20_51_18]
MKKIILAANVCALVFFPAICAFSADQTVDFDGTGKNSLDLTRVLKTNPQEMDLGPVKKVLSMGTISAEVAYKSESGEWIVQPPMKRDDKNAWYTFPPDTEIQTWYICEGNNVYPNYWQVSSQYTNFPSNAGHTGHPQVPNLVRLPEGTDLSNPLVSQITPINTPFKFYWKIPNKLTEPDFLPAYASKISHTGTFYYGCGGIFTIIFEMKVLDLKELTTGAGYILEGANPNLHKINHFGTAAMTAAVKKLATDFDAACSTPTAKLSYNDMSLVWGGLYDLNGDWKTPHKEHRFGINLDVGKRQVKKANRKKLIELMCGAFKVRSEGDVSSEPKAHYHLTLKDAAKSGEELVEFDIDPKYTNCCPTPPSTDIPEKCIDLYDGGNLIDEPNTPSDCQ